eukprot:Nitzschia sp. Nitz4//scaffold14_size191712//101308//103167//NITZ4_001726-RA/size191712-processed-gene-0.314-mRNA-1//-1//CDS//3329536936//2264//frame0
MNHDTSMASDGSDDPKQLQERIAFLEKSNASQQEQITRLIHELNESKTKHKEGVYWLQLQLDQARRDTDATEEQMAELMGDLRQMTMMPESPVSAEVLKDAAIQQYEQVVEALEHQVSMVKTTAGEVVKTLKEEIADLMEDRATMELGLLNQIAALDSERGVREEEMASELQAKDTMIQRLRSTILTNPGVSSDTMDEYEEEIGRLMDQKKHTEERMHKLREESEETVQRLEHRNAILKEQLDEAHENLEMAESAQPTGDLLEQVAMERQYINDSLEIVAGIWDKADLAVHSLQDSMDKLRPDDDIQVKGERERLLSTLETAALVQGQIKVSLLLVELKLRNQLNSLKHDHASMGSAAPSQENIVEKMESIEAGISKVLHQVEHTLTKQIAEMEASALEETKRMKEAIQQRSSALESMQKEHRLLEEEVNEIKRTTYETTTSTTTTTNVVGHVKLPDGIPQSVLDALHLEVMRVLERVKEKNALITALQLDVENHKQTEEKLKTELKRFVRKTVKSPEQRQKDRVVMSPKASPKHAPTVSPISPRRSPPSNKSPGVQSPVVIMAGATRTPSPGHTPASSGPTLTPTKPSKLSPLKPSPREISKGRTSGLMNASPPLHAS